MRLHSSPLLDGLYGFQRSPIWLGPNVFRLKQAFDGNRPSNSSAEVLVVTGGSPSMGVMASAVRSATDRLVSEVRVEDDVGRRRWTTGASFGRYRLM